MSRSYPITQIRNIGIIAHIDAGKTTTTERVLYYTGRIHKLGNIDDGTTAMDWTPEERKRGITITSAATYCRWRDCQINIIDTPGHIDFTAEVNRSLRVLDGAVVVLDGSQGVEPQSETNWRLADRYRVPRLVFANKMDKVGADFDACVRSVRDKLGVRAVPVQLPIGAESSFAGVVDLVHLRAYVWRGEALGARFDAVPIPAELEGRARQHREAMIEALADHDDGLARKFLDGADISAEEIKTALRKATINGGFFPMLCGSSFKNKAVQPLLDAVCDYLPSPADLPAIPGRDPDDTRDVVRAASDEQPFCALAFKVQADPHVGKLTYFRIYSGHLAAGTSVLNASRGIRERVGRILRMHANKREEVAELHAGDIAAAVGLRQVATGETLCAEEAPIVLEPMQFPEPVIAAAIEPKLTADLEKLAEALGRVAEEDPTLRVVTDAETDQTIIAGMGELHLEIVVERIKREYKVDARLGRPEVAYRETIRNSVESEGKYIKQTGGHGQYGHVWLKLEPLPRGQGFEFVDATKGGSVPRQFVPAVEKGLRESLQTGVRAGYPMVDLRATLFDGSSHQKDSSEPAFKIAASLALKDGARRAGPVLLEPIMRMDVVTPTDYIGDVLGDLMRRRGTIASQEPRGNVTVIRGHVPLAETFGYVARLRSLTQGRATYSMEPSHYQEVPPALAAEVAALETAATAAAR
jgi:elongation factor G